MSFLSRDPVTGILEIDILVEQNRWKDAEVILLQSLADATAAAGKAPHTNEDTAADDSMPEVQRLKLMLAHVYRQVGRYNEAESKDRAVLETRLRSLGPHAQETLIAMNYLAVDMKLQPEKLDEGLSLQSNVLEIFARMLWPEDFASDLMTTENSSTATLHTLLRHPEAESPAMDLLVKMCHVADEYFMHGRAREALRLHEIVLRLCTTAFGPGHPFTIAVMDSTGRDYVFLGRLQEAVRLLQDAAEAGRVHLGSQNSTTCRCIVHLAEARGRLIAEGDGTVPDFKTIAILEQGIGILERSIGYEEADTVSLKYYLAVAYARLDGRFRDSEFLQNQVLNWCRQQEGTNSMTASLMVRNLALMYRQLGRMDKAREIEIDFARIWPKPG